MAREDLNSPEARVARENLFGGEARRLLEHLRSPEAQAHFEQLRRPETRRFFEQMTSPENTRFYEETMRYAKDAAGRAAPGAGFSLPLGFPFGIPGGIDANAIRAATEAARTAEAQGFVEEAARLAREARISLPDEAGLAGQLAAARRFLGPVREAQEAVSAESIRGDFAETLARARELLSDPNVRRMLENVDAESVVAEGLEAAEEAPEGAEDGLTAEEIDVLLGPDSDVEILVPWVNYALILFGVAWLVATGSPEYLEYKEPLEDMLTRLGTLRAALEEFLKKRGR